jgi:serine protease SohB
MIKSMVSKVLQKEMLTFGKAMIANELPAGLKKLLQRESDRDPLIRKQFQITNLNELRAGAQANITDITKSPIHGNHIRDAARRKRLKHWNVLFNKIDDSSKKDKIAKAIEVYQNDELKRKENFNSELKMWRSNINSLDPHTAPKAEPFFVKWFKDDPEKKLQKIQLKQLHNEKKLLLEVSKIDSDIATTVQKMLENGGTSPLRLLSELNDETSSESSLVMEEDVVYIMDFKGDTSASQVQKMKEEISVLLTLPNEQRPTEIILRLHSSGGYVFGYGLAGVELSRIKKAGIKLTICIDEVAASGGYMMACVADQIISSPWSIIGSVGVISGVPNMSERMNKEGLKFYKLTSGKNKNTLDPFTEPTKDGLEHVQKDMDRILKLFSDHVEMNRSEQLTKNGTTIDDIANGDTWQGIDALQLGLVDSLLTSEEYIQDRMNNGANCYAISKISEKDGRSPIQKLMNQNQFFDNSLTNYMNMEHDMDQSSIPMLR